MRKWGRSGIAILAGKMLLRTERVGPYGSAFITGMVFGLGFDTATQISAISVSAVASATQGIQVALSLVAFFGLGMVTMDTLNSVILRSAFWKIFQTKAFRYMAYGLSAVAIGIACVNGIGHIVSVVSIPEWSGPVLAAAVISSSFSYAYFVKKKGIVDPVAR
jgi:high-affinity nickel-transport protein